MKFLAFDIETVVSAEGKKLIEELDIKAPSNYKDQEKISAYIEEKRKNELEKAALYWWTGKIVCISAVEIGTNDHWVGHDDCEKTLIQTFLNLLMEKWPAHMLVGKNSEEFDEPWVRARAMRHDLGVVPHLRLKRGFSDVQRIFGYTRGSGQVTSLENIAKGLYLTTQKKIKGAEVETLWNDLRHKELREYCLDDSRMVAEIWQRYAKEFEGAII
jgi:3'-5' exonuclease